jgi:cation:H+ antiporter
MIRDVPELLVSLVLLSVAGDRFVVAIGRLARTLDMRRAVIGMLIGGVGTSLPELLVAGLAAHRGASTLALGSVVGSIIANTSLGLGLAAVVSPVHVDSLTIRREAPISVASVFVFALVAHAGLTRGIGDADLMVLVALGVLLVNLARRNRSDPELTVEVEDLFSPVPSGGLVAAACWIVTLTVAMILGAELLVDSAVRLAERFGVSQGLLGVTLVGLGTSAPLIASSIQAARRGDHDIVAGDVLGANIVLAFAGAFVIGLAAPGTTTEAAALPLWAMALLLLLAWAAMARGAVVRRWEGAMLALLYLAAVSVSLR